MSSPYLGEVRIFAGNFAPYGWAYCQGQLMSISQNTALFSLLGTTYGGDGQSTFALPDLRGRAPIHFGQGPGLSLFVQGQVGGTESVTLTSSQMPQHNHALPVSTNPVETTVPGTSVALGQLTSGALYTQPPSSGNPDVNLGASSISLAGGSQPHSNLQPYLVLNYIIAVAGIFPARN